MISGASRGWTACSTEGFRVRPDADEHELLTPRFWYVKPFLVASPLRRESRTITKATAVASAVFKMASRKTKDNRPPTVLPHRHPQPIGLSIHSAATPSLRAAESVGPISIELQCSGERAHLTHAPSRGACTKCCALPNPSPYIIRRAKSTGNAGVARGSESRINGK